MTEWTDRSFTFNGEPMPLGAISAVRFTSKGAEKRSPLGGAVYEYSFTIPFKISWRRWKKFVRALAAPRRFRAPFTTLMRRASYGGRKGRRAMRRLLAMSDSTWRHELRSSK